MGLTHLDAGVLIGLLDAHDAHHTASRSAFVQAREQGDRLAMSASALAECLVGPWRASDGAVTTLIDLLDRLPITVVPLDTETAVLAARLRAQHPSLRLPDALVIATAERDGADSLVTTDRRWPPDLALNVSTSVRQL